MSVARFDGVERGPSGPFPTKGAPDGPRPRYPTVRPNGRGAHRPFLPPGRRLCPHQPEGTALRVPQESLGLGGHHPRALPTASRRGVRALLPARRRPLLLAPVPRGGRSLAFLLAPSPAQAAAFLGALAARHLARAGGRTGDPDSRLDPAWGLASAPGGAVGGGLRWGGVGEVGLLLGLRGQAAPLVCDQPGARLLRDRARERRGRRRGGGTARRGGPRGRGGGPQAARGPRLPEPAARGGAGR